MTSQKVVVHCTFCDTPYNYDFTTEPRMWCNKCNKQFRFKSQLTASQTRQKEKVIEKSENSQSTFIPPKNEGDFIDDPNELLMSVAIRELNRANPDPRWASILINCKKENITNKSEVIDKFNQLPTQTLVNLLSKSLQEEH